MCIADTCMEIWTDLYLAVLCKTAKLSIQHQITVEDAALHDHIVQCRDTKTHGQTLPVITTNTLLASFAKAACLTLSVCMDGWMTLCANVHVSLCACMCKNVNQNIVIQKQYVIYNTTFI